MSQDMIQALGVIVGLVIVAVLVIRASSSQSAYATRSMENVVSVMAGGLRDDLRETQKQIHNDLRAYQAQVHDDQKQTRERVEAIDNRLTKIGHSVNLVRDDLGERVTALEREALPPRSRNREPH